MLLEGVVHDLYSACDVIHTIEGLNSTWVFMARVHRGVWSTSLSCLGMIELGEALARRLAHYEDGAVHFSRNKKSCILVAPTFVVPQRPRQPQSSSHDSNANYYNSNHRNIIVS